MRASLPMYARPELIDAHAIYWQAIRAGLSQHGIKSPQHLTLDKDDAAFWRADDLLLSQTCGLPYRIGLHAHVTLIGTPDYGLTGCPPGYYRSAIVVRADDPRTTLRDFDTAPLAINGYTSQSGYAAICNALANPQITVSGAHRASAQMVAAKQTDIAALDAVSWALMQRYDPFASDLRVLEWTAPTPGLPYICATSQPAARIAASIQTAIKNLGGEIKDLLMLKSLVQIPKADYLAQSIPLASTSSTT
jgi:ABC-type phosphate/phosphonate transport system substrate-binding protein